MIIGIDIMFIMSYNMIGRSISGIFTLCIMLMQMPLSHTSSHSIISHGGACHRTHLGRAGALSNLKIYYFLLHWLNVRALDPQN